MSEDRTVRSFPCGRTLPTHTPGGVRDLGVGALARQLGACEDHLNGHWCSRCEGLWYGLMLEVQCPVCGNRNG
jgi:hypothetical protein